MRRKISQGAERFEDGGRSFMQSRCVQLARMGQHLAANDDCVPEWMLG